MNSVRDEEKGWQTTGQDGRHSWGINPKACCVASVCFVSMVGPSALAGKSVSLPAAPSALGSGGMGSLQPSSCSFFSPMSLHGMNGWQALLLHSAVCAGSTLLAWLWAVLCLLQLLPHCYLVPCYPPATQAEENISTSCGITMPKPMRPYSNPSAPPPHQPFHRSSPCFLVVNDLVQTEAGAWLQG